MSAPVPSPSMKGRMGWSGTLSTPEEDIVIASPCVGAGKFAMVGRDYPYAERSASGANADSAPRRGNPARRHPVYDGAASGPKPRVPSAPLPEPPVLRRPAMRLRTLWAIAALTVLGL